MESVKNFSVVLILLVLHVSASTATQSYNVLRYGAKPNGKTDSAKAFLDAWNSACGSLGKSVIYVPKGRYFIGGSLALNGPCRSPRITIRIDGTLVAPVDYNVLGDAHSWLNFQGVSGVSIVGGNLDAQGTSLWACKSSSSSNNCPDGSTTLSFTNSNNIKVKELLSLNSQRMHIAFNGCQNVHLQGVKVIASGNSPNTDGVHIQFVKNVVIMNSSIRTGDDCISIGPGSFNLWIQGVKCGPGHGISIGSLAKEMNEEGVQNVTVTDTVFTGTTNGFRIKSWARPSNGYVNGVRFNGARMENVKYPIIIDQNYCPHKLNCPNQVSGTKISDVTYEGIRGTSATKVAIKLDCSATNPCTGIGLKDVNLRYVNSNKAAQTSCANVKGASLGLVQPDTCL